MADLSMTWAGDLTTSPTGDLLTVDGPALGTERVLRRLMTNPGDYIWNPTYGAGLGQFVGQPINPAGIQTLIISQMALEVAVSQTPEPIVVIRPDISGQLYTLIRYVDAETATSATLDIHVASKP